MAKVSIGTLDKAAPVTPPPGLAGASETRCFFDRGKDPIHLHIHDVEPGDKLRVGPLASDCVAYVWHGSVAAGGRALAAGSSIIVEHGASTEIRGGDGSAQILTFFARQPSPRPRAGGNVHLLPSERVPRRVDLGEASAVGGGMHADASCPTCELWLHENSFPPRRTDALPVDVERGIHSHTEDEVIFVTSGRIRFGARFFGPGTAIAIAAGTMYAFSYGDEGMSFINFRPGLPSEIRLKSGMTIDEVGYWKDRLVTPDYISFDARC
jgi:hypothetical protein